MTLLSVAVAVALVVAIGVSTVAWWSAARARTTRLLWLASGFTCMALGAAIAAWQLWSNRPESALLAMSAGMASGLVLNYWAAARR
ncbi:MAG: DUF7521 family protein [Thermoplasmatota archaeon]